ncbi:MAG TPA: hypothetical protein VMA09_05935 [Candidatus Binataceae bacterium]|nr:hypothetical protein [Candidatus Binataceae bacterium]
MNARHAAALALLLLVASMVGCERRKPFWLMMMPPVQEGQLELNAPMMSWSPNGLFGSFSECEQARKAAAAFSVKQAQQMFGKMFKNFSEAQIKGAMGVMSNAVCIASDDPRLAK